jgi:hypothetical protein
MVSSGFYACWHSLGRLQWKFRVMSFCKPTTWHDVIVFLLDNFVAHVANIPQTPGAKWYISLQWSLIALLLPFVTLTPSVWKLCDHFLTGGNDFKNAYAARALVVVIRTRGGNQTLAFIHNFTLTEDPVKLIKS